VSSTPFGTLRVDQNTSPSRRDAVVRGLGWCYDIASESPTWDIKKTGGNVVVSRTIGNVTMTLHPMVAAMNDLGQPRSNRFTSGHLPLYINDQAVCVIPDRESYNELDVDLVACFILFFSRHGLPPAEVTPNTVKSVLYPLLFPKKVAEILIRGGTSSLVEQHWEFASTVNNADEALAYLKAQPVDTLHHFFPVLEFHDYHQAIEILQNEILSEPGQQRPFSQLMWAFSNLEKKDTVRYQQVLRDFRDHRGMEMQRYLATHIKCSSSSEARLLLLPLLHRLGREFPAQGWRRLLEFEDMADELFALGTNILGSMPYDDSYLETMAVLSEHINVDMHVRSFLESTGPEHRKKALIAAKTYELWLEDYLLNKYNPVSNDMVQAAVTASFANPQVDEALICQKLMIGATGWAQKYIMNSIGHVQDDRVFEILETGTKHPQRFVVRCAVSHLGNFSDHPRYRACIHALMERREFGLYGLCKDLLNLADG